MPPKAKAGAKKAGAKAAAPPKGPSKKTLQAIQDRLAKLQDEEKRQKEEEEAAEKEEEEREIREKEEAERKAVEDKERAKQRQATKAARQAAGLTKKQKEQQAKMRAMLASGGMTLSGVTLPEADDDMAAIEKKVQRQREQAEAKKKEAADREQEEAEREEKLKSQQNTGMRAPICCVMGHVDTGKTKLLDRIRKTNVQTGEAGGITQQIGASFFPISAILDKTRELNEDMRMAYQIPGLLIIDTPGHESFTNLRARGSGLCDIAILVIDIMHGLEQQTRESIELLKSGKTPFIVALNKVDRLYDWVPVEDRSFRKALDAQKKHVKQEFETRLVDVMEQLSMEGLNSVPYWKNRDFKKNVSLVPTSAMTGEGISDLLLLMVQLTQKHLEHRISKKDDLQCTVLEVKVVEGLSHTIDVILVNGTLREGDEILIGGLHGPIQTSIRALLTPPPLREIRIKSEYIHHKEVHAALGVKISAGELENAVAGSQLLVIPEGATPEEVEELRGQVDVAKILKAMRTVDSGVIVQASTLGSLEALMSFLKGCKIPVSAVNIGPIHKKDVMRAACMHAHGRSDLALILAFDVPISREAQTMAEAENVHIFSANIIYHLFDMFKKWMEDEKRRKKEQFGPAAVFPCELKIVPGCVFNAKDPILLGLEVLQGRLRLNTPLTARTDNGLINVGRVMSIEWEHKAMEELQVGQQGAVKINPAEPTLTVGRQFGEENLLISTLTRDSLDALKAAFMDEMKKRDWDLVRELKPILGVL